MQPGGLRTETRLGWIGFRPPDTTASGPVAQDMGHCYGVGRNRRLEMSFGLAAGRGACVRETGVVSQY